jgi:hypothetical protein
LIIIIDVPRDKFRPFQPRLKMNSAGGSLCPTKSDDGFAPKYNTKSVSEDLQVLQINLHRGSLSSINRERGKAGLALAAASDS